MSDEAVLSPAQLDATPPPLNHARRPVALDADVLRWFQDVAHRSGGDAEALINTALRDYIRRAGEPLERTLRRVLREELRKAG